MLYSFSAYIFCIQAEKLGCDGKVEEAQGVMKLVDQLKDERELLNFKVTYGNLFSIMVTYGIA